MRNYKEYRVSALAALKDCWPQAILATAIVMFLSLIVSAAQNMDVLFGISFPDPRKAKLLILAGTFLFNLFLVVPFVFSYGNALKRLFILSENNVAGNAFNLFKQRYARFFKVGLPYTIILVIGYMLFVIPGIILSLCYAMTVFLADDAADLSPVQTMRLSRRMMEGHKWELFCLYLTFAGWILLVLVTVGVAGLWVTPYMRTAKAAFYVRIRTEWQERNQAEIQKENV